MYAELRRQARLRVRLPAFGRRVNAARAVVADAMCHGPAAILVSGGKDSTALLHLARAVDPALPAVFVDDGAQTPWTCQVLGELRALGHTIVTLQTTISVPEMRRMVGMHGYDGPERLPGEWHWTRAHWREVLVEQPQRMIRDMGYPVQLMGLRAEESRGRLMNRKRRGLLYGRANGITVATPLADWTGADVLAYCVTNELPLSPVYLQPGDERRDRRRTATALMEDAAVQGEWQRLRVEQPAFWYELARELPGIWRDV